MHAERKIGKLAPLISQARIGKPRTTVVKTTGISVSKEEIRSLLGALTDRLPCNQQLIRVAISRSYETKDHEKEILGFLSTFCVLDKLKFLFDFKVRIKSEGAIEELEVNGEKMGLEMKNGRLAVSDSP